MQKLKTAISLALAVSAASVTLNVSAAEATDLSAKSEQLVGVKQFSVLPLNYAASSLLIDELSKDYQIAPVTMGKLNEKAIARSVESHDVLYINGGTLQGKSELVNAYISEAMKQGKPLVLENTHGLSEVELSALPQLAKGDVVTIYPSRDGADDIQVYESDALAAGSVQASVETTDSEGANSKELTSEEKMVAFLNNTVTLDQMDSEKRSELFADLGESLRNKLVGGESGELSTQATSGGAFGYPCTPAEKDARLCSSFFYTWSIYSYDDGEDKINMPTFASGAMYRTNVNTVMVVSNHGSANKTMTSDSDTNKAWYLMSVGSEIVPQSANGFSLFSRKPGNVTSNVTEATSSGISFGVSGGADPSGPGVGGDLSYSESNTTTLTFTDWGNSTTSNTGTDARWLYRMRYPNPDDGGSFVSTPAFKKPRFKSLPVMSTKGTQFTTEGVWTASKYSTSRVDFDLRYTAQSQKRYFTERSIFHWKTTTYTRDFWKTASMWMNAGWLKSL